MRNASHRRLARLLMSVLTTGLMVFGISMATTPSASAATCTSWSPSANGEGAGLMVVDGTHLKNNYYAKCDNNSSISSGTVVWLRCYKWNSANHLWWYVRDENSNYGWTSYDNVYDYLYDDNGDGYYSPAEC